MNELMLPKEMAEELFDKFLPIVECGDNRYSTKVQKQNAKQAAVIAVNLILKETGCGNCKEIDSHYWNKVLHELELMKETN